MTAPLILKSTAHQTNASRHNLEQEREVESEHMTTKEACISEDQDQKL